MQLMLSGQTGWSYGGVNIENVGGTAVLLPTEFDPTRQNPVVVHVEVSLCESIPLRRPEGRPACLAGCSILDLFGLNIHGPVFLHRLN